MLFLWMQGQETLLRGRQPEKSRGGRSGPLLYGSRRRGGLPIFQSHEKSRFTGAEETGASIFPWAFLILRSKAGGLGSALVLEFLLYYMTRPEYQIHVREEMYLDNMLDLF